MEDMDIQRRLKRIGDLLDQGDIENAERMATFCTLQQPQNPQAWFLLGVTHHLTGDYEHALDDFEHALNLQPTHVQALSACSTVLSQLNRHEDALILCRKAHTINPDDADLIANVAITLDKLDSLEDALEWYDRALAANPLQAACLLNRGGLLSRMGRIEEALANNQLLVERFPSTPEAFYNLSENQLRMHDFTSALATCDAGLSIAPRYARLHMNRGLAMAALKKFAEAQKAIAEAQVMDPALLAVFLPKAIEKNSSVDMYACAEVIYLEAMMESRNDGYWENFHDFIHTLNHFIETGTPSGIPLHDRKLAFSMLSLPLPPEQRLKLVKRVAEYVMDAAWISGVRPFRHKTINPGPIRIGYVSPDLRNHTVGHLTRRIYGLHDRSRFEIHCYSLFSAENDSIQQEISVSCDHWHDLSEMDHVAAAKKIHDDAIDILVDLAGYTRYARPEIFAMRPAPVQASYLGYPGTMGGEFMDYAILDSTVCPAGDEQYLVEQPVKLPGAYCPYDNRISNAQLALSRNNFGLPENKFVFCCFNATYKIDPHIFAIWAGLLQQCQNSVLWLLSTSNTEIANLRREAARYGIAPERLVVAPHLPHEQHLARLQLADLYLDTYWHNAHTMAADALWQGLPVLTCTGRSWSSRLAASLLKTLGLEELVTETLEEYSAQALRFAHHPNELAAVKNKLISRHTTSSLFDTENTVRNLERGYLEMWQRWSAGEQPTAITVSEKS